MEPVNMQRWAGWARLADRVRLVSWVWRVWRVWWTGPAHRRAVVWSLPLLALLLVPGPGACSSSTSPASQEPAGAMGAVGAVVTATVPAVPMASPSPVLPDIMVNLAFVHVDREFGTVRFVAYLSNPDDRPRAGVRVRWDALDATGALLGGIERELPVLAAGETFTYVGGAGGLILRDLPETVRLTVLRQGQPTDAMPVQIGVRDVTFQPVRSFSTRYPYHYRVRATLVIGEAPVRARDVSADIVLRGADGAIVGADFESLSNVPDVLPPGTAVVITSSTISTTTPAARAEVSAAVWPRP